MLPLKNAKLNKSRVFVEVVTKTDAASQTEALQAVIRERDPKVQFVARPQDATVALVLVRPNDYADANAGSATLNADTGIDVQRIKDIEKAVPTVLAVNAVQPWILDKIEPGARATIATFDVNTSALWDVIRGKFAPQGKLPLTMPKNQAAVDNNAPRCSGLRGDVRLRLHRYRGSQVHLRLRADLR